MKLYLDMCALKRPFDDQSSERIAAETHAVLSIMSRVENGVDQAVWSTALSLENDADPDVESRAEVDKFSAHAQSRLHLTPEIELRLKSHTSAGMRPLDAAHVAFAEAAECDILITCDDHLIRQAKRSNCLIRVMNPIEYVEEVGHG